MLLKTTSHLQLLRHLCQYLRFFLITPWYNFTTDSVDHPHLSKLYGTVLLIIKVALIVVFITDKSLRLFFSKMLLSQKFVMNGAAFNITTLNLVTLFNSLWKTNQWKTLFVNLRMIEEKSESARLVTFVIKQVLFFSVIFYLNYVWTNIMNVSNVIGMTNSYLDMYLEYLFTILLTTVVTCLKVRYEYLNDKLRQVLISEHTLRRELKKLTSSYRVLKESVDIFNNLFGLQIILIIFHFGFIFINGLNCSFFRIVLNIDSHFYQHTVITTTLILICMTYIILSLVLSITSTVKEAEKFIDLCYKMQNEVSEESKEMEFLITMTENTKNFLPNFSACGFFTIDKSLIFSIIGNVAMYFIITIQLNESEYQTLMKNESISLN